MQYFYGIGTEDVYDLDRVIDRTRDIVSPAVAIPIANDSGGNKVYLDIAASRSGRVFFLDHEDEARSLIDLAADFDSFLAALQPGGCSNWIAD